MTHAANTVLLITIAFIVCYGPYFLYTVDNLLERFHITDKKWLMISVGQKLVSRHDSLNLWSMTSPRQREQNIVQQNDGLQRSPLACKFKHFRSSTYYHYPCSVNCCGRLNIIYDLLRSLRAYLYITIVVHFVCMALNSCINPLVSSPSPKQGNFEYIIYHLIRHNYSLQKGK